MPAIALQSLPLGFRFQPKDEELVNHYLKNKITGRIKSEVEVIPEIDVCKCEPWELPAKSLIKSEDPEWFFFAPKDRKYPSGHRSNRATKHGYWKATGRDRMIRSSGGKGLVIGMKKTLVFHEGRAPKGVRTYWIMHEYRTTEPEFESGDEGSYVLYRLFNKKSEEKSPSSKTDDLEIHDFSPDGMQNGVDAVGEIEIQSNHESPKSVLQEEPIESPGSAKKQLDGIEMWVADKGQCSTRAPVNPETDCCNMALLNEETKLGETADPLQDFLFQLCDGVDERVGHGFSNISSPMLQIPDNPSSSAMNQESHMGSNPFDDDDYLNALLNSMLDSDDCSSGACSFPKESPAESLVKQAPPWDSASCKDSGSNSEIEIEPCLTQGATSQWLHESSLGSSDLMQMDGSSLYPESATQLITVYENASLFPYGITGPDGYSVDAGAESMDELFNSIEEFNNQSKISDTMEEDFEMPGIKIRSPQSNNHEPPSSNSLSKQGIAIRRICLQGYIRVPSTGADADTESNHMVDDEDKNSIPKASQTLSDSTEESSSDKSITDKLNESMEIGIKIRDREVQHSPNALSPQDKHSSNKSLLQSTSDSESQVGDNDTEEVENIEQQHAGDSLGDKISEGKENTLPTSPNKLEEFSIHDADETTSSSSNHQNPESMMRLRKKSADGCDKSVKQSSNSMGLMNHSVVAHMIHLVLSLMVLLFVCGIYRLAISTVE
ncbi:protein NTM1-like 9 isoform X1 [Zingiber officinale]|uniref:protein NTM1-like 9 isoform X1 n=1 Tax=Zingiber officinale TaxID=94328 RepID=UPI001C4B037C|nr:protein NTM1-like 9 isoform X1 [Zingiber officinale]